MEEEQMPANSQIVIRKYGDRRLYDTSGKRYVKLEDIKRMVREGAEVEVIDARTGRDLTRVVLTQIIVEDSREKESGPPLQLLRQMVMASDRATHEFLASYLTGALDLFKEAKSAMTSPLDYVRRMVAGSEEVEELRRRVQELEARLAVHEKPRRRVRARRKEAV